MSDQKAQLPEPKDKLISGPILVALVLTTALLVIFVTLSEEPISGLVCAAPFYLIIAALVYYNRPSARAKRRAERRGGGTSKEDTSKSELATALLELPVVDEDWLKTKKRMGLTETIGAIQSTRNRLKLSEVLSKYGNSLVIGEKKLGSHVEHDSGGVLHVDRFQQSRVIRVSEKKFVLVTDTSKRTQLELWH